MIIDNPLICDCQLRWYRDWLKKLRDKDDEMMQKKRTICTMITEHREYNVQNLPLEKMNCIGKNMERTSSEATRCSSISMVTLLTTVCYVWC